MHSILTYLLYAALLATVLTLVLGFATMLRKSSHERTEQSNKLMRWRIMFQAIALIVLAILLFMSKGTNN